MLQRFPGIAPDLPSRGACVELSNRVKHWLCVFIFPFTPSTASCWGDGEIRTVLGRGNLPAERQLVSVA